jgi:hypothetical protein|tara:strand:+ start:98 stop:433 length:336 start_codon:yes stop_codon:yes gene_type:complete
MQFNNITSDEIDNIMNLTNTKFNEAENIKQLTKYVESTYSKHYSSPNGVQSMDLISSSGLGLDFCLGNVLKYASRYGKKNGANREDLMKIMHYTLLAMNEHDLKENNGEEN